MRKRITVADVAREAGVSMMTVSRAMNNKPGLSEELRKKILKLADDMGYRPSQIARGLVTRQTGSIGLIVPDITNPFFAHIARGVEDVAFEQGYSVYLINAAEDVSREMAALDSLWQKEIDGAIVCSPRTPIEVLETNIKRFPAVVLINRELRRPIPNVVTINVNDHHVAMAAVQHFVKTGRSKIALIAGPSNSISSQRRLEGYRQALKAANLTYNPQLIEHSSPTTEGGRAAALALLARRPDIDAIFAFNDPVAVGAMQVCQESGRSIPDEIGVIGVDDVPLATIIRPRLSTLRVNQTHIGRLAMRTLLEILKGDALPATYQIEPELILRDSI